ncbi:MAG: glycosyltransferase family 4 protein [Clostridiales bacterium]|nr:glycosyltransferase family 4 protein [Clostridiales bacterium]
MKILITTDWYLPAINGVVTSVLNLERELRKNGHEVKILTLSQNHHSHVSGNVIYMSSFGAGMIYPNARIKLPLHSRIVSELIQWSPDIIHSQCEFSTFLFAKKIGEILDIPIIHTYHTIYEDYTHYLLPNKKWGKKVVSRFSRSVSKHCERMIAPTQKVKSMLHSYHIRCAIDVIPTGIDLDKFYLEDTERMQRLKDELKLDKKDFVAVYIGRLAKEKNIDELIRMHARIDNPNAKLLIVGDGPRRGELQRLALDCGLSDRVIFTGMVAPEQVYLYYKCGDVFVSASTSETQGLTYIEALASGLPLICRKDDCLDGVVDDVVNGFQYIHAEEYCNMLNVLAQNPNKRKDMSHSALMSSQKFSREFFGKCVENLYREAIKSYRRRRGFSA